ncbi:MAG: hypothetical protein IPP74_15175 [Alphaproteobacteria bacterium]|nr:hypothetical protein [Alphaproteobacteria bacterium]
MQYSNSDDPIDSQTYEALGRYIAKFSLFEAHLCDLFRLTLSLDESASLLIKSVIETSAFMKLTFEIYQRKVGNIETQLVTDCKNVIEYRNRSVHSKIFTQVTGNPISTSDTSKITFRFRY